MGVNYLFNPNKRLVINYLKLYKVKIAVKYQ